MKPWCKNPGSKVSDAGRRLVTAFRAMEAKAEAAVLGDLAAILAELKDGPT